ncbi:efflux transporter outer membrane subunit [Sulfuriferula nivalis]|uniref:RND transporter n=1 Tax=Sulfuriferula nivalis TaxID=2675298 RepID=A0A809S1G6_9PROT|nr:efflux transporter outer membrane subunit [Sulfuriferula nivalis]BBP00408.1 RND transporter [Sulfuriferula nivalis]
MNIQKYGLYLTALLLLSACSVGPDFKSPTSPQADTYIASNESAPLSQRIAMGKQLETEWWSLFASAPLNDIIHQTIANNYDLAAAKATLAQAEETVRATSGSLLPQATLGATAGRQKYGVALFGPSNFVIPPFSYYEVGPTISWTLDLSGSKHRALERQQALTNYQAHEVNATYMTLTGDAVATTLEMAAGHAESAAIERMLAEDHKTLTLVEEAYAAGAMTKLDILNAKDQLNTDQALLPPIAQRISISRHALAIFVGKTPANWTPPEVDFNRLTLPQTLPVSLPSELIKRRPDILAAEANLHAASAAIGVATGNLYPQLTLSANMMQEALTPAGLFNTANNAWSIAAGLTAPLFNGGTLNAQKREAEQAYQAALAQYQQTILVAFRQVADGLTALAHDDETLTITNQALNNAYSSLDMAHSRYQAGAIGLLPLQDAQRILAKAQLDMIRAQHQRYADSARLLVALGGSPIASQK